MKNIFTRLASIILCLCLLLTFAACKKEDKKPDGDTSAGQQGGTGDMGIPDIFGGGNDDPAPTPPDVPDEPDTPDVPPAPEVIRSTAYDTRVTSDEIIMHNGITIGMGYDQVAAYSGYEGEKPADADSITIEWDKIQYTFTKDSAGEHKLTYVNITEEAVDASIFRDIRIGDSLESVIGDNSKDVKGRIPAKDTELKKWAIQFLYGYEDTDPKGYADLRFIALSYYTVNVFTPEYMVSITFAREGQTVKWIEMYAR